MRARSAHAVPGDRWVAVSECARTGNDFHKLSEGSPGLGSAKHPLVGVAMRPPLSLQQHFVGEHRDGASYRIAGDHNFKPPRALLATCMERSVLVDPAEVIEAVQVPDDGA